MRVLAKLLLRPEAKWPGGGPNRQLRRRFVRFIETEATPSRTMRFVPAEGWAAVEVRYVFLDWEGNVSLEVQVRQGEDEDFEELSESLVENGWEIA